MKKNMGGADRIVHIILALTMVILYFTNILNGTLACVLLALSGVFVLTSFMSF